jgi:5-methylcytosine-specific restriction endonuclease McrA
MNRGILLDFMGTIYGRSNWRLLRALKVRGYSELIIDYVIPLCRGGSHSEDNMKVACPPCNLRKGSKLPSECDWLKQGDGTLTIKVSDK